MPPRQLRQEESWNSLHRSEASGDISNDDFAYSEDASVEDESGHGTQRSGTASPTLFQTISHVQKAIHPLQATADRVGRQVEQFAESLDRLTQRNKSRQVETPKDCRYVLPSIEAYKNIATETVHHLRTMHAPERQRQLAKQTKRKLRTGGTRSRSRRKSTPRSDGEDPNLTTVADLKQWELEKQTWDLLKSMIQIEYPVPEPVRCEMSRNGGLTRPSKNTGLHTYSSEKEIWDNYLATDDLAWERHTVIEWLKSSADQSGQDIDQVVQQLESDADRGSGLYAHSWLYTREAIKGQKRLLSWPRALEPGDPGLDKSLRNADKTKSLVTQLDPDAITRQGLDLEKQDFSFERAMWLACWEMLRRGKSWNEIRDWGSERVEQWRAASMQGDLRLARLETPEAMNWQSRFLWRKTCALAAKDGSIDDYEKAVYGVLSGYLPSVQHVSQTWDDNLFAHYNAYLLHSYDRYIKHNFSDRVPAALGHKEGVFNFSTFAGQRAQSGNQIVEKLKQNDTTKEEARGLFKMLQSSLIAKNFDDFVFKHGVKLTHAANAENKSKILQKMNGASIKDNVVAPITLQDYDLLRIVSHIIFIYQDLGFDFGKGDRLFATESIIVAYVDYLSKAGKQQLLPLYASRLSHWRSLACLGRQLPLIQQRNERVTMMHLMKQSGLDVPGVLLKQLTVIMDDSLEKEEDPMKYPDLRILERVGQTDAKARPVQGGFIGDQVSDDEADLIHGFEWFMLLEGYWEQTMAVGVVIYKHFLRSHRLAAARMLSQEVKFSAISLSKTHAILGRNVDISVAYKGDENGRVSPVKKDTSHDRKGHRQSNSAIRKSIVNDEREILFHQSSTFRDLENLFVALNAMEEWRYRADQVQK